MRSFVRVAHFKKQPLFERAGRQLEADRKPGLGVPAGKRQGRKPDGIEGCHQAQETGPQTLAIGKRLFSDAGGGDRNRGRYEHVESMKRFTKRLKRALASPMSGQVLGPSD